jgi:hypothetical protein
MSLAEPKYEELESGAKAEWHERRAWKIQEEQGRGGFIIDREYRAEKHFRTARRIMWAAEMRKAG